MITIWALLAGGVDTGWTFYAPYSTTFSNTYVVANRPRYFHKRLLIDSDRTQLHRHDSHDARAGYDMVPPATIYLVALRDSR